MSIGKKLWAISGGVMRWNSSGDASQMGEDILCILNTTGQRAKLSITIFYENKEAVPGYCIGVEPQRKRKVRFNDFIDPEAIILGVKYSALIESSVPVVIQFTKKEAFHPACSVSGTLAYSQ